MDPQSQKKIDVIMYETNEIVSAIVNEIRDIRFSKMDEEENKQNVMNYERNLKKSC